MPPPARSAPHGHREPAFHLAVAEELWLDGVLREARHSCGCAREEDGRIVASSGEEADLLDAAVGELASLRAKLPAEGRVRLVASSRRVGGASRNEAVMTITLHGLSVVDRDPALLRAALTVEQRTRRDGRPLLWLNGSAAVLLHEAAGHPAEHGAPAVEWPHWLTVADEPPWPFDDTGKATLHTDLLSQRPSTMRRESFRNVPLARMSKLVARQSDAPFVLPPEHVEVHLVSGGSYDPLTDVVTVDVAASTAGPFTIRRRRAEIAQSIAGARGEPLSYPGVICSREGQELVVESWAPVLVTHEL